MIADNLKGLEEFEAGLWRIADNLRANSNLASNEYFMPIMGLLFLRQATNRYNEALEAFATDKKVGKMADREPVAADFARRRALMLPPSALRSNKRTSSCGRRVVRNRSTRFESGSLASPPPAVTHLCIC
jgi:type I restriction-modification system DNA methylase subunit